jgi:hypothetical protein
MRFLAAYNLRPDSVRSFRDLLRRFMIFASGSVNYV